MIATLYFTFIISPEQNERWVFFHVWPMTLQLHLERTTKMKSRMPRGHLHGIVKPSPWSPSSSYSLIALYLQLRNCTLPCRTQDNSTGNTGFSGILKDIWKIFYRSFSDKITGCWLWWGKESRSERKGEDNIQRDPHGTRPYSPNTALPQAFNVCAKGCTEKK